MADLVSRFQCVSAAGVVAGTLAACAFAGLALAADAAAPRFASGIPDFSSNNMGWASNGVEFLPLPGEKFVPISNDPAHPHCGNRISPKCGNQILPPIGDTKNPILQPWAAAQMKQTNDEILGGKESFEAMSRCWPGGVPGMMLFTAEPTYFLQTPKEVTILYSRGTNIRHVYLDAQHSKNPPPTWLGESIGHYEGDELVIDTVGLNDKTFIDWYHTPHTEKLHVVERYKLLDGGKRMQGIVTVDDPGAFTTKWSALHYFNKNDLPISNSEYVCAENNNANYFGEEQAPIPEAKTPDF
jgi:hypothetical protein